jgi:DNA (cytosine-5)-methyltransferase 1
MSLRFVSAFAGVGGFDLALEARGHRCVGQIEKDRYCNEVLAQHWPSVPRHDDIVTSKEWADEQGITGAVDLVVGGFPCQDLSVAGRRAGFDGERSSLFFDFVEFAVHVGAKHIILENVPGLLTSHNGRDFEALLQELADAGYPHIEWRTLDSQFFGVPQRRRRVFIVATAAAIGSRPILVEPEERGWDSPTLRAPWASSTGASPLGVGCKSVVNALTASGLFISGPDDNTAQAGHLVAVDPDSVTDAAWMVKSKRARAADDDETWLERGVVPTLNQFDSGDVRTTTVVGFNWQNGGGYGNANPGLGITENGTGPLSVAQRPAVAGENLAVRRLTPVECERLQGFPDDHTACVSMSQRFRQMGNAVTVPVVDYVAWLLEEALA